MDTKKLRQKILDLAIRGKLVPQDPNDEPASVLLERIKAEKEQLIKEGKIKRSKKSESTDKPHYENVPFEIPESWVWTTLGTIGKWQSGATPSRMRKDYYGGGIPWLKTGDLNDGFITDIPETITPLALSETSVKLNPAGSILIAMYGATIGKIGILTKPATTNQACCACVSHNGVEQMYLFYFLLSYKEEFIRQGGGGAQPNISKEKIIETYIPLPPLCEQNRIVNEVAKWNKIIDNIESERSDLLAIVSQIKSKILDFAISGKLIPQNPADEPAIELLKRINSNFIPCDNSHYEKLPNGWCVCRLEDICQICDNKRQPINSSERQERKKNTSNLYPYYGATGQVDWIDDYMLDGTFILLGEDGAPFLDKNADKAYIVSGKFWVNNHAHILYPRCNVSYLTHYLNRYDYSECVNGSTRLKLTQADMKNIDIFLPPLNEQLRISQTIRNIFDSIDAITAELQ